jgi:hypothetical protein
MSETQSTRREVLKKAVYVTPAVLTLPVFPSFAATGSGNLNDNDQDKGKGKGKGKGK